MTSKEILDVFRSQIGVKENPANSNNVKYNTDYYGRAVYGSAYPWCMAFVWDCFRMAGASDLLLNCKTAYCPEMVTVFKNAGQWVTGGYMEGDILFYNWNGGSEAQHTGIAETVTASGAIAIEGNTAVGNDANGGAVMRRTRSLACIIGAGRPKYKEDKMTDKDFTAYLDKYFCAYLDRNIEAYVNKYFDKLAEKQCSTYARDAWAAAKDSGVMDGTHPQSPLTREQFATVLHRLSLIK